MDHEQQRLDSRLSDMVPRPRDGQPEHGNYNLTVKDFSSPPVVLYGSDQAYNSASNGQATKLTMGALSTNGVDTVLVDWDHISVAN